MSLLDDETVLLHPQKDINIIMEYICNHYTILKNTGHLNSSRILRRDDKDLKNFLRIWYEDGIYNVSINGRVALNSKSTSLTNDLFRFVFVNGDFYCDWASNLKTLEGLPLYINGDLSCSFCDNLEIDENIHSCVIRMFRRRNIKKDNAKNIRALNNLSLSMQQELFYKNLKELKEIYELTR